MRYNTMLLIVAIIIAFPSSLVYATTAWYQPTPYPTSVTNGIHLTDGWITSVYYGKVFIADTRLQVGGWGDTYRTYIKFDTEGLPSIVSTSTLWLMPFLDIGGSTTTAINLNKITSTWNASTTWSTQPTVSYMGQLTRPQYGVWWGADITSLYNEWRSGTSTNYGVRLDPVSTSNTFSTYRPSRYTSNDAYRPMFQLDFTSPVTVPDFKMPLPGALSWLVTTEPGGWDCMGSSQDDAHTQKNYFSVDFPDENQEASYSFTVGTTSTSSVPIIAAADGRVISAETDPHNPNGYYVVLDHGTGATSTEFTTRYLHLKYPPSVSLYQNVSRGDLLGYMGTTGEDGNGNPTSTGIHLHFGVRYNDTGASTSTVQYATNDGWLLKSFQTECVSGAPVRYYLSSNTSY